MANKNKVLPGMLCDGVEFFLDEDSIQILYSGKVTSWPELPLSFIQMLKNEIDADPKVKMHLLDLYPNSEYKRLEQYVKCRFGGLDYTADINADGIQEGEWWDCPLRGKCASEGVLCKAVHYNGHNLNANDIAMARHISTSETNEVIAEELKMPMGSFHLAKKKLYQKLGVQTKQETTIIAHRLNLI